MMNQMVIMEFTDELRNEDDGHEVMLDTARRVQN